MPVIHTSPHEGASLEGRACGASICLILDRSAPGQGPRLHRQPYDETWVVQHGAVTFQLGEDLYQAGPGDVVIAPPGVPHKFTNDGPEQCTLVCIHANPTFITEWLE